MLKAFTASGFAGCPALNETPAYLTRYYNKILCIATKAVNYTLILVNKLYSMCQIFLLLRYYKL